MRTIFLLTIFLSSTLLFMVQPMLAKAFLPKVGGAPATWMVCMMFFQLLLLAGYAYAAMTSAKLTISKQMMVHGIVLLLAAAVSFPLATPVAEASAATHPIGYLLSGLFATIALPYFALSAHSSLLQRWYFARFQQSPYHLFAASNAGSLLGLLGYPLLVEWYLALPEQYSLWMLGYGGLVACISLVCFSTARTNGGGVQVLGKALPWRDVRHIVALAFIPSSLFLSTTLAITTDIASFPLLWVLPLALYLITMILAYSRYGEWWTHIAQKLHIAALVACAGAAIVGGHTWFVLVYLASYFVIAMHAHGKLAAIKPRPEHLASYYFWLSVGGALGGVFNVLAPYIFNGVYEFWIVLLASFALLPRVTTNTTRQSLTLFAVYVAAFLIAVNAGSATKGELKNSDSFYQLRNFYGVSRVFKQGDTMIYAHGSTVHGKQSLLEDKRLSPTTYYGPIYELVEKVSPSFFEQPFGFVGLGVGTLLCTAKRAQSVDVFEIDQAVVDIASNPAFFTYMRDCPAATRIVLGDGRITLSAMPDHHYSLLVIDAFTSDAIPLHLLTKEAIEMYLQKIHPTQGIIAFNVSNRHIDLVPMLSALASEQNMAAFYKRHLVSPEEQLKTPSLWLLMVPNGSVHESALLALGYERLQPPPLRLWTDDYTNILPYIMWSRSTPAASAASAPTSP